MKKPEAAHWAKPVSEAVPGPSAWHNLFLSLLSPGPRQQRKFCGSPRQETGPPRSGAQPKMCGSVLTDPHPCMVPTSSPLCFSFLSCNILSSFKQENWLLYQRSFFQSYCLTYCLCQEFQKVYFETKKLRIDSFVLCSMWPCSPEAWDCPSARVMGGGKWSCWGWWDRRQIINTLKHYPTISIDSPFFAHKCNPSILTVL